MAVCRLSFVAGFVTDAYQRRCAISGEKTLPVLEAAHIRAHAAEGPNRTSNGLLLHADLHKLFDNGYLTITPDYHIEVSSRIKEQFQNGREYYRFHGQALKILPKAPQEQPEEGFVRWDDYRVYVG